MRRSRLFAGLAVGLALVGAQFGLSGTAHAEGVSEFGFDSMWGGGRQPQVLPQDFDSGHAFQLTDNGQTATSPVAANVLVVYTLGAPKLDGTDVPDLPTGFTTTPTDGTCVPAAQAATGTGTAAFICDMAAGAIPYASFDEHIGTTTPDGTVIGLAATIVPQKDNTLAKVQAAQRHGAQFTTNSDLTGVESLARAQQDSVSTQASGFTAGQTATATIAVHAVDDGRITVEAADGTPGEVWTDPSAPWIDWQDVFLPQGLNVTSVAADAGASCTLVPLEYQNTLNDVSANTSDLATCDVTPATTSLTLTFTSAATLPQTAVQLTAGYHVFDNTSAPFTSSTADFTVSAAP